MAMGERTTQKISEFQGTWYLKVIHMLYGLLKHKVDIIIAVWMQQQLSSRKKRP